VNFAPSPLLSLLRDVLAEEIFSLYERHRDAVSAEVFPSVALVGTLADNLEMGQLSLLVNTRDYALESVSEVIVV